ncbi:MAG TPA: hypothetical protein VFS19_03435 [Planctomycetota bacterium]|nr:hypothetical protein [Planctomycetota bacterium]
MGSFKREGTIKNREAFLAALKGKLEKLRDGVMRGATLEWKDGHATLEGFGARVVFQVGDAKWTCDAQLPPFIPIPQRMIEAKFDEEFKELNGL